MASKERFSWQLSCPQCGASGTANTWQKDGYAFVKDSQTYLSDLSEGFRELSVPRGTKMNTFDFYCTKCNCQATAT